MRTGWGGRDDKYPAGFRKWCSDNGDKIAAAEMEEKLLYFVEHNKQAVRKAIKAISGKGIVKINQATFLTRTAKALFKSLMLRIRINYLLLYIFLGFMSLKCLAVCKTIAIFALVMEEIQSLTSGCAIHPGVALKKELRERGITQKSFATRIGILPPNLSEIVRGRRNISKQLAKKIATALDMSSVYWENLQAKYDYQAKTTVLQSAEEIAANMVLYEYDDIYDMRAIFKIIGFGGKTAIEKLKFCKSVLRFASPAKQRQTIAGRFHRSGKTGLDIRRIVTWAVLAEYEAAQRQPPTRIFDKDSIGQMTSALSVIFHDNRNTINRVDRTLSEYGIKFCIVPRLEKASIDGYSFYDGNVPVIVVTRRFDRIDNLAFAVLHEVGHLALHLMPGERKINLGRDEDEIVSREESEANRFAANALIPEQSWKRQPLVQINPHSIQAAYTKWAKDLGLNKWIVLGRLSYETGMYMFKSDETRNIK